MHTPLLHSVLLGLLLLGLLVHTLLLGLLLQVVHTLLLQPLLEVAEEEAVVVVAMWVYLLVLLNSLLPYVMSNLPGLPYCVVGFPL